MSIFIASLSPDPAAAARLGQVDLDDYLPLEPQGRETVTRDEGRVRLLVWRFGAPFDRPVAASGEAVAHVVGLPREGGGDPAAYALERRGDAVALNIEFGGGYCGAIAEPRRLSALNGYSGEYCVYYRQVRDGLLISNRLSLLLAHDPAPEIDPVAGAYLAARGYIYGRRTAWEGVRRLAPGDVLVAEDGGFRLVPAQMRDMYEPIPDGDAIAAVEAAIDRVAAYTASVVDAYGQNTTFPLSGGRDSRAVLACACAGGRKPVFKKIYTRGFSFSPEVLAAKNVVAMLDLPRYAVRRPELIPTPSDLVSKLLVSLSASEGQFSVFDWSTVSSAREVSLGGNQALRDAYFPDFPSPAPEGAAGIVAEIEKGRSWNPGAVLSPAGLQSLRDDFTGQVVEWLEAGVRPDRIPETFLWRVRTGGWVAIANNALTYAASPVHPLLDRGLTRLALGLSRYAVQAEIIHFRLMARAGRPLWDLPFAFNTWPDNLADMLDAYQWPGPRPARNVPYEGHPALPVHNNPATPNEKALQLKLLGAFARRHYGDLRERLSWLDSRAMEGLFAGAPVTSSDRMIAEMGAHTALLCAMYGRDLFRRSRLPHIAEELSPYADAELPPKLDENAELRRLLEERDVSLGEFLKAQRTIKIHRACIPDPLDLPWPREPVVQDSATPPGAEAPAPAAAKTAPDAESPSRPSNLLGRFLRRPR